MGINKALHESIQAELTDSDLDYIRYMLDQSTYDIRQRELLLGIINTETDVEELMRIKQNLYDNSLGIDGAINPSQKEVSRHIKKFL